MRIDLAIYRAFALDLDGVVTNTAAVHAAAWKQLFDELLERRAAGRTWLPFDSDREYRAYVDGKPRRDGLRGFLAARGISIPEGTPGDSADAETIHALAKRKNKYVHERIARDGVQVYGDAVALLRRARASGVRTAVVTASENGGPVLAAARITGLFDARVDGLEIARLGLRGKPASDSFVEAARRLGVPVARTAVFEDAIAGVQAARAGRFGLVIGIDRNGHGEALRESGADHVVSSLDEIELVSDATRMELR
ncbi:MAG TPA: HAD-IA family hydrolase [Kofleriaceae bacterium]|nr:HAD-IA family hydrolase [Kofleriaceae bacterium]